jgi:hypothetical protein
MKMTRFISQFSLLLLLILFLSSFVVGKKAQVKGWFLAGSKPDAYEIGIEKDEERNGNVAFLKSIKDPGASNFGTIMQNFTPDEYLGKRVKLSGYIKSKDIKQWAGMWFRVDGEKQKSLSFDNMQDRAIKGTNEWKKYEIVLDVPKNSVRIAYGVLVSGEGTVWMDDLNFEVVSKDVPLTKKRLNKPQNSNFEESQN